MEKALAAPVTYVMSDDSLVIHMVTKEAVTTQL
jgi:hypothetical protein